MILIERIEQLMRELKIKSWRELARLTRISPSYMGDIKCRRTQPSLTTLHSLAASLETSISYLIGETDSPRAADEKNPMGRSMATHDLEKLVRSLSSEEPDIGILLRMTNKRLPEMDDRDKRFLAAVITFALNQVNKDTPDR